MHGTAKYFVFWLCIKCAIRQKDLGPRVRIIHKKYQSDLRKYLTDTFIKKPRKRGVNYLIIFSCKLFLHMFFLHTLFLQPVLQLLF